MKDRYDFEVPEGPEQTKPDTFSDKLKTHIQDDEGNEFPIELDYSYAEFLGDQANQECTVRPLGEYSMTVESFKESVQDVLFQESGVRFDAKHIIIL